MSRNVYTFVLRGSCGAPTRVYVCGHKVAAGQKQTQIHVRCSDFEREAWHRYAARRNVPLAVLVRTTLNNMSGVHDPPHLEIYDEAELILWANQTTDGVNRRRR